MSVLFKAIYNVTDRDTQLRFATSRHTALLVDAIGQGTQVLAPAT